MNKRYHIMFLYKPPRLKQAIQLSDKDMLLLRLICDLGFVNANQLQLLYAVTQRYPTQLARSIISKWCSYSGLLSKKSKTSSNNVSQVNHTVYVPTINCRQFLQNNGYNVAPDNAVAVNSHNEQAIEVVVQALYSAMFKHSTFGASVPVFVFNDNSYKSLGEPERTIRFIGKPEELNQKSRPPFSNQIIFNQKNQKTSIPKGQPDKSDRSGIANQNQQSEVTTRTKMATLSSLVNKAKTSTLSDAEQSWLNDYLQDCKANGVTGILPYAVKQLSDSLLDGTISNNLIGYLLNGIDTGTTTLFSNSSNAINYIDKKDLGSISSIKSIRESKGTLDKDSAVISTSADKKARGGSNASSGFSGFKLAGNCLIAKFDGSGLSSWFKAKGKVPSRDAEPGLKDGQEKQASSDNTINASQKQLDLLLSGGHGSVSQKEPAGRHRLALSVGKKLEADFLAGKNTYFGHDYHSKRDASSALRKEKTEKGSLRYDWTGKLPLLSSKNNPQESRNTELSAIQQAIAHFTFTGKKTELNGTQPKNKSVESTDFKVNQSLNSHDFLTGKKTESNGTLQKAKFVKPTRIVTNNAMSGHNILTGRLPQFSRFIANTNKTEKAGALLTYSFPSSNSIINQAISLDNNETDTNQAAAFNLLLNAFQNDGQTTDTYRYPTLEGNNIYRNLNLISNPKLDLTRYDTSSFKNQYKFAKYTFVADEVISFERNERRQEVFIELDNRTESNATQIQKMLNYISYALDNPQRDVLLVMATTDGSLDSPRLPSYSNIGRKLANLADKFMKSYIPTGKGNGRTFLSDLYNQASNLKIVLSGVSEAHIDISQFILGSNYTLDYLNSIDNYVSAINNSDSCEWKVKFEPSSEFKYLLTHPLLAASSINDLQPAKTKSLGKGIWQYVPTKEANPVLGYLKFEHKSSLDELKQPILAGDEHSLDTVLQTYRYIYKSKGTNGICPPVTLYPKRERPITAITLPEYAQGYTWNSIWSPGIPLLIQPKSNDFQLHKELRWLTIQYDLDIYNFFKYGNVSKKDSNKIQDYGNSYIHPLDYAFRPKHRTYAELHEIALSLDKKSFIDQLELDEIPVGLFQFVLKRWPHGQYSLPTIEPLPFWDELTKISYSLKDKNSSVHVPNSVLPDSRIKIDLPN